MLEQGIHLLAEMEDGAYTARIAELGNSSIGGHMRHILEFYECFLEGSETLHVDYDARRRDSVVETNRVAALDRARAVAAALRCGGMREEDGVIWVRGEEDAVFRMSSLAREMQMLASHTTHHYALVAVAARILGLRLDPCFGVARSTLRHWKAQAA